MQTMAKCNCSDPRHNEVVVNRGTLKRLLDYCRADEAKHYEEADEPKGHIYRTILKLDRALKQEAA